MPMFRAIAKFTTYAEVRIHAKDANDAWEIAREIDGGDFHELAGEGDWEIEIFDA